MKKVIVCAAVFLLAAMAGWSLPAPEANAGPANGYVRDYYSDATKTEWVGSREMDCNGKIYTWGVQTAYYDLWLYSCY